MDAAPNKNNAINSSFFILPSHVNSYLMETIDDNERLFFVDLHTRWIFLACLVVSEGRVEPVLKIIHRIEDGRQEEVKKSPQFREIILFIC
jgi:hypothetical protein